MEAFLALVLVAAFLSAAASGPRPHQFFVVAALIGAFNSVAARLGGTWAFAACIATLPALGFLAARFRLESHRFRFKPDAVLGVNVMLGAALVSWGLVLYALTMR